MRRTRRVQQPLWFPPSHLDRATALRIWKCPKCTAEAILLYDHRDRFCATLPASFKCPTCEEYSPAPWPCADQVAARCRKCGRSQLQLKSLGTQESLELPVLGRACTERIHQKECDRCVELTRPPPLSSLSLWKRFEAGFLGGVNWGPEPEQIEALKRLKSEGECQLKAELNRLEVIQARCRAEQVKAEAAIRSVDHLRGLHPTAFEDVVGAVFAAMGWTVFWTPTSGDHGIDLVLVNGNKKAAVQCKRYKRLVSEPEVRSFFGSFTRRVNEGYYVTTSNYTNAAQEWARRRKTLHLISGDSLVKLIAEFQPTFLDKKPVWRGHL